MNRLFIGMLFTGFCLMFSHTVEASESMESFYDKPPVNEVIPSKLEKIKLLAEEKERLAEEELRKEKEDTLAAEKSADNALTSDKQPDEDKPLTR